MLKDIEFDYVIIDEAAQGLEASCWIPMMRGRRCVLAGDHLQLPPTIKSKVAESKGLGITLFERAINDPTQRFSEYSKMLDTQYRMNALISNWASTQLYSSKLLSHESVASHTLADLIGARTSSSRSALQLTAAIDMSEDVTFSASVDTSPTIAAGIEHVNAAIKHSGSAQAPSVVVIPVLLLLDTADCGMNEEQCQGGTHKNIHEAELVLKHVRMLVRCGISPSQIGVITPYNGQLEVLKQLLLPSSYENSIGMPSSSSSSSFATSQQQQQQHGEGIMDLQGIEIRTVDGFQGGEKECIIFSLVRSNDRREVGFLGDNRRINVGVTRAKRHLCVVSDTNTCGNDPFIYTLLNHMSIN